MIGQWFARFVALGDPIWSSTASPPQDKRELGTYAKQLLDDPVLHLALERVEDTLIHTWKSSDPADQKGRERVYAAYQGMQRFKGELQRMIANASMNDADQ